MEEKNDYNNDGLIFTPVNEPYPKTQKWSKLLKWKPIHLTTIDFFSIKKESVNGIGKWELYVQGFKNDEDKKNYKTSYILFNIENTENFIKTYETEFDDNLTDPCTNQLYLTNTVIEFRFCFETNKFIPIKTRWDKTQNPAKHGNFYTIAKNIWNNLISPITLDQLYKMTNDSTIEKNNTENFFFKKLELINNELVNNNTTTTPTNSDFIKISYLKLNDNIKKYEIKENYILYYIKEIQNTYYKIFINNGNGTNENRIVYTNNHYITNLMENEGYQQTDCNIIPYTTIGEITTLSFKRNKYNIKPVSICESIPKNDCDYYYKIKTNYDIINLYNLKKFYINPFVYKKEQILSKEKLLRRI